MGVCAYIELILGPQAPINHWPDVITSSSVVGTRDLPNPKLCASNKITKKTFSDVFGGEICGIRNPPESLNWKSGRAGSTGCRRNGWIGGIAVTGEVTNKGNLLTKILGPMSRQLVGLRPIVWVPYGGANTSEKTRGYKYWYFDKVNSFFYCWMIFLAMKEVASKRRHWFNQASPRYKFHPRALPRYQSSHSSPCFPLSKWTLLSTVHTPRYSSFAP